ncbi:hypothetical protein [Streptomyces sp. NPDC059452]
MENADLTDPGSAQTMADLIRAEISPIDISISRHLDARRST